MKAVLISIQPKWCELIASGKKTVEVRKTRPKLDAPFKAYIYMTAGNASYPVTKNGVSYTCNNNGGKCVIGEFMCDCISNYEAELWDDETFERIQELYEPDDFTEYGEYEYQTIADNSDDFWKENMLCKASCLTIEELRQYVGLGFSEFYGWHISNLVIYDKPKELSEFYRHDNTYDNAFGWMFEDREKNTPITRPPQSWCYVEETGGR